MPRARVPGEGVCSLEKTWYNDKMNIINGDCLDKMRDFPDNHFSGIVTDPPYGISFMGKEWDYGVPGIPFWEEALRVCKPGSHLLAFGGTRTHHRLTCAIEDAGWEIRDCILWCFGSGFPKSHNFGCKCTGDPVPYSHENTCTVPDMQQTISQAEMLGKKDEESLLQLQMQRQREGEEVNKIQCQRERKEESGKGNGIGEESCLEGRRDIQEEQGQLHRTEICEMSSGIHGDGSQRRICDGASSSDGQASQEDSSKGGSGSSQRPRYKEQCDRQPGTFSRQSNSQNSGMGTCERCGKLKEFKGFGTSLKPAYEPIIMAMKPCEGTFAQNAERWGQAGINVDSSRIGNESTLCRRPPNSLGFMNDDGWKPSEGFNGSSKGRWPANLILDEEAGEMLDQQTGMLKSGGGDKGNKTQDVGYGKGYGYVEQICHPSSGGASRFFYCAKASSAERNRGCEGLDLKPPVHGDPKGAAFATISDSKNLVRNNHPTVKPLKLMEYLVRLIAPPKDAIILDPFAGSGTTLLACQNLGIKGVGIEMSEDYCKIATARCLANQSLFSPRL